MLLAGDESEATLHYTLAQKGKKQGCFVFNARNRGN